MREKVAWAFNAIIFLGFVLSASGAFLYVASLLQRFSPSFETVLIALGLLTLLFGVLGARIFSSLELAS